MDESQSINLLANRILHHTEDKELVEDHLLHNRLGLAKLVIAGAIEEKFHKDALSYSDARKLCEELGLEQAIISKLLGSEKTKS